MVKQVKDFVDKVLEKFPYLSKSEINKIITFGLKRYAYVNRMHCDVLLKNRLQENITMHCGNLGYDTLKHYLLWMTKWRMKERILYKFKKMQWDGYYYIGLTQDEHDKIMKSNKIRHFRNVYFTKIKKELYHNKIVKHIWRVPYLEDCGWKFFVAKYDTDQAEYIGENKYELYHTCFLNNLKDGEHS